MRQKIDDILNPGLPVMVVDDEAAILFSIDTSLRMAGLNNIITCNDSRKVMDILSRQQIEIMLLDLTMPYLNGEDLLGKIISEFPEIPIVIITGTVEVETAVRCMKTGAFDYVVKPLEESRLITAVKQALSFKELKRENLALKECILSDALEHPEAFSDIITNNKQMLSLFKYVETIASTSQPILITGETGVGKELIARAIHEVSGFTGLFTPVNVAGLDDHTFSDTLFGHVKGAFTGADRDRSGLVEHTAGGTLLLDEIGDLKNSSQVKLLRLLQEGEYLPLGSDNPKYSNARILTATNQDLWSLQEEGTFRRDLFYRLGTYHIHVPPVRERMDDVPLLVANFLEEAAHTLNKKKPTPPKELFTLLNTYGFPGNVRELRAMVFDAVSRHTTKMLSLEVFKSYIKKEDTKLLSPEPEKNDETGIMFPGKLPTIKQATELLVEEAMNRSKGNQSVAAQILGISQPALSKRLKKQAEHP